VPITALRELDKSDVGGLICRLLTRAHEGEPVIDRFDIKTAAAANELRWNPVRAAKSRLRFGRSPFGARSSTSCMALAAKVNEDAPSILATVVDKAPCNDFYAVTVVAALTSVWIKAKRLQSKALGSIR